MKVLKQIWRKIIRDQKINMLKILNDEVENLGQICRNKKKESSRNFEMENMTEFND